MTQIVCRSDIIRVDINIFESKSGKPKKRNEADIRVRTITGRQNRHVQCVTIHYFVFNDYEIVAIGGQLLFILCVCVCFFPRCVGA